MGGCFGPRHKVFCGFDNTDRHLVVILERPASGGLEGFHALGAIPWSGGWIRPEIEATFVNDAEKPPVKREPIPTEHGAAGQPIETIELIIKNACWLSDSLYDGLRPATTLAAMGKMIRAP